MINFNNDVTLFVIDTNRYAGCFERKMCAYITGRVGDCRVGCIDAGIAQKELEPVIYEELKSCVSSLPDQYGINRPVTIYFNNDGQYNSVAILLHNVPSQQAIDTMKQRANRYADQYDIEVLGFRIVDIAVVVTRTFKSRGI